jgi:hypothetical protein
VNRPDNNPAEGLDNSNLGNYPNMVDVYSDNHGEAMVYLNGDWNLDLSDWVSNGAYDIPTGAWVGTTEVEAWADYPYFRKHTVITSNSVLKEWLWGKDILGTDPALYPDGSTDPVPNRMVLTVGTYTPDPGNPDIGISTKKMAFVWVTDRDGFPVVGETIEWYIESLTPGPHIPPISGCGVSNFNYIMESICVTNGFLSGTNGQILNPDRTRGRSWTMSPEDAYDIYGMELSDLFAKFWPTLDPDDFGVAAIEVESSFPTEVDLTIYLYEREGTIIRHSNLDFSASDPLDDPVLLGDSNMDGTIDMGDVISAERMILGLGPRTVNADANWDKGIDMGDVIRIERLVLGR